MTEISIGRRLVVVNSFAEGQRVKRIAPKPRTSERDILAKALWLESHKGAEAADEFLERWCVSHPPTRN